MSGLGTRFSYRSFQHTFGGALGGGMVRKIVSGGQTGADRAALDVGLSLGMEVGGYVPQDRRDEFGLIPARYPGLEETSSDKWSVRTRENVLSASHTLIFTRGPAMGGTRLTVLLAARLNKPFLVIDLQAVELTAAANLVASWLASTRAEVLNVAGPRASQDSKIYVDVRQILTMALRAANQAPAEELKEALANFRHWDIVRWTALFWYLGLSAPASLLALNESAPPAGRLLASLVMALLGVLTVRLVHNTQKYHIEAGKRIPFGYAGMSFRFDAGGGRRTATVFAKWVGGAIAVGWMVAAIAAVATMRRFNIC